MKIKYTNALFDWLGGYDRKVPRKIKKHFLGTKMSRAKLRKRIDEVTLLHSSPYENSYTVLTPSDEFCPNCGCERSYTFGNRVSYPQVWQYWYCLRCNEVVAYADNHYPRHILVDLKLHEDDNNE